VIERLRDVKLLTFDVGGTVFDWHSAVSDAVSELARSKGVEVDASAFAVGWRELFFVTLAKVRSGALRRMNADGIHRLTLDEVGPKFPALALSDEEKDDLTDVWHRLPAWPDANPAIQRLRGKYTVVVLTVLSFGIVVDSSKHSGIDWDAIISCEFLQHYKPDVDAYLDGLELLGVEPREAMMVAAHEWDLKAAREAGLATAYVPRPRERGDATKYEATLLDVDVNARDFIELADILLSWNISGGRRDDN
jgi:2-haloacid dehalogenase